MIFANLIDAAALVELLQTAAQVGAAPVVLLDCRFDLSAPAAGLHAYRSAHLPGARYIDLNRDLSGPITAMSGRHPLPAPATLARRFGELGITPGIQVVVYDAANGSFAARAWWLLRWLGHLKVALLDGGMQAWVAAGGLLAAADAAGPNPMQPSATNFPCHVNRTAAVSSADVQDLIGDPTRLLVDARAAERYAGRVEPIDAVAGHIPGALNHPFTANLQEDGRFLPAAELRRCWQERVGHVDPANLIVMCGSGVTACHNLLALELAGLHGAKLYAGSWSEWIRNPERPVARRDSP